MREDQYALDAEFAEHHWWWVARRKILSDQLSRYLGDHVADRRILEVGCSTGSNLPLLRRFGQVEGMEMNGAARHVCQQRHPDIRIAAGAIPEPLDQPYDVICLFDVLEHIENDIEALDWVAEGLVPGGYLFLTVPAYSALWSDYDVIAHHHRRYARGQLLRLVKARFTVEFASYFNTHLFPLIAPIRVLQRVLGLSATNDKRRGGAGLANQLLTSVFAAERFWLRRGRLPVGVSLLLVARRSSGLELTTAADHVPDQ
jgi:SAM-dependent methyltransferase